MMPAAPKTYVHQAENFAVRPFCRGDEEALALNANDREIWINLRDRFPHPYTREAARQWIAFATDHKPTTNFAIEVDGEVAGGIGIFLQTDVHAKSGELGYWLAKKHWGKGIMSACVAAMTDYFFQNHDLVRIYANVFAWNGASAKVLEKAGYEYEGRLKLSVFKDNKFTDQLLYARVSHGRH